jgi:hypothetical protein
MSDDTPRELIAGQRYTVKFADCCVGGRFTGTYLDPITDPDDGEVVGYRFDVGDIGPEWGNWSAEPA